MLPECGSFPVGSGIDDPDMGKKFIMDRLGSHRGKAVRAAINAAWGKKPICNVLVSVVK